MIGVDDPEDQFLWRVAKVINNYDCKTDKDSCDKCPFNNYGSGRTKFGDGCGFGAGCGINKVKDLIDNYSGDLSAEEIAYFFSDGIVHNFERTPTVELGDVPTTSGLSMGVCQENKCSTCPIEKECRKIVLGEKK